MFMLCSQAQFILFCLLTTVETKRRSQQQTFPSWASDQFDGFGTNNRNTDGIDEFRTRHIPRYPDIPSSPLQKPKPKRNGASSPKGHSGKMNAAGFFYISADFSRQRDDYSVEEQQKPLEDLVNEDCSIYPNGTYKAPYAFTCSDPVEGPPLLVVHDTAMANRSGHYEYPIDLSDGAPMLRVFMDLTSYATQSFESMRAEIALLRRKVGWLGCGWMPIPTFGAFDSMDICEANDSCPIFPGRQVLELRLEPSSVFMTMLRLMLHDDKPPYEMRIRLINNRSPGRELLCVAFQTRLLF